MRERLLDEVWESGRPVPRLARGLLAPLGWLFGASVWIRNVAYDRGWLAQRALALPGISVGNLTVGGTGKTPMSAWIAARLRERGAIPAVVLRGYGGDEPLVHERLNPGIVIVADANRVRGVARARAEGASVAVLDDACQHRRARRDAEVILLSAERFGPVRLLPAGPWREPLTSLGRADVIVVTRKSASPVRARELLAHALRYAPGAAGAIVWLAPDSLAACDSAAVRPAAVRPVAALSGERVLAISAVAQPQAFEAQLRVLGADVTGVRFGDHHRFSARDAAELAARATDAAWAVCTLKDAVKLAPLWPREAPPLWYLSQRVSVESGAEGLDALITRFAARTLP